MNDHVNLNVEEESKEHNFLIKYKNEEQRRRYGEFLLDMIQKFELKDFSVVEEKAYTEARILYNLHTIAHEEDNLEKDKIEKNFLEIFER